MSAEKDRYVAYLSTYTRDDNDKGIRIFDVDVEKGRISERGAMTITNASYATVSHNGHFFNVASNSTPQFTQYDILTPPVYWFQS